MKIHPYIFVAIMLILYSGTAAAVTIQSNVTLNLTNVNLTVNNLTFDSFIVGTDTVSFNQSGIWSNLTLTANDITNITLLKWNITDDYQKSWNKSNNVSVNYTISGLPSNSTFDIVNSENSIQLISNALGLVTYNSTASGVYELSLITVTPVEDPPSVTSGMRTSFVSRWENVVSLIGVIIIISLAGSMLMIFKGKKSISDILNDLPGILLVITLIIIGAIIFGRF